MRQTKPSTILIGMTAHKLVCSVLTFTALSVVPCPSPSLGGDALGQAVPAISDTHRRFLSRLAHRTIRDAVLGRDMYEASYVPAALESLNVEVVVRVRERGYLLAAGVGGPLPVAQATRDAALVAAGMMMDGRRCDVDLLNRLLIEIEVVGPAEPLIIDGDWTRPRAVDLFIEPGVHGMAILGPRGRHRFCPTEVFTSDTVLADALEELAKKTHGDSSQLSNVQLMRFRTVHWYQPPQSDNVVSLHRGMTLVPPEAVSPEVLDETIARLAEYMVYRQLGSGLFTYQYEPGLDRYSEEDNLVRQVGATLAMAVHAKWSGKSASLAAADIGIRYHLQGLTSIPDVENGAYIATADKKNKLGVTALLCVALAQHPDADRHASTREKLANGMLWLQRPSGIFITAFPPAEQITAQDYFPGEALLALAAQYDRKPSGRILEAFDCAIDFYRVYFHDRPSPAFVPWQVQAYTLIARHSKRRDYVDYVFELTDWLAERQLNRSNCQWPELWGGIASYQPGRAGVSTAAYLEGFADALALARSVGDTRRAKRYESLVRGAARFVMQLQIRPEEAFFIRSPKDAVGAVRTTPTLNLLRIDHCQHALVGLIKTRQVLFPDRG